MNREHYGAPSLTKGIATMSKFENGIRVKVHCTTKYGGKLNCKVGTVVYNLGYGTVGVSIDGATNSNSDHGWFYFYETQLEILTDEGVTKMEGNYRIALVKFLEGSNTDKAYEYACYNNNLAVNDKVVVKTAHHGFSVGVITGFAENVGQEVTREIVGWVDFKPYEQRIEARKRRDELRKEMAKKAAQMQEIALYKLLAQEDATMSAMVKEYTELLNGN